MTDPQPAKAAPAAKALPKDFSNSASASTSTEIERIKIGEVARHFGVSVDLLRLYEREGLLIPLKSPKGTRYFTQQDYPWIATLLRLVREARLNFAGIRHLLALLPCWELRQCQEETKVHCELMAGATSPCWIEKHCCHPEECYFCEVYRAACRCENLKAFASGKPA